MAIAVLISQAITIVLSLSMKVDRFFCGSGFCSVLMLGDFAHHWINPRRLVFCYYKARGGYFFINS